MIDYISLSLVIGFILAQFLGNSIGLPNFANGITALINLLRGRLANSYHNGVLIAVIAIGVSLLSAVLLLKIGAMLNVYPIIAVIIGYQSISAKNIKDNSIGIFSELKTENLAQARAKLATLTDVDTSRFNEDTIIRSAVEVIAKNYANGIVAPMFYFIVGGVPLVVVYTAIARINARLSDNKFVTLLHYVATYIPSIIAAYIIIVSAYLLNMDYRSAYKIYQREAKQGKRLEIARAEAACAGALGIKLIGDNIGIGVDLRKPEDRDIITADNIATLSSLLALTLFVFARIMAVLVMVAI